jgi:hypothetical protein
MANSCSRGDWQLEKPVAVGLLVVILESAYKPAHICTLVAHT